MKKLVYLIVGMLASALVFAGSEYESASVQFSSDGPDTYRDGTTVLDGEFYALVWVPTGADVPSFFADGTILAENGCKILAAGPWASNGGCGEMYTFPNGISVRSPMSQSIPRTVCETLIASGSFRLCLLDSRKADQSLASTKSVSASIGTYNYSYSFPTTVNGYKTTAELTGEAAKIADSIGITSPIAITTASAVPAEVLPPHIVSITPRGEGDARVMDIEVECTYEYLQYTVAGASSVKEIADKTTAADGATAADGDRKKLIVITVPAKGNSNFYRVIRK